MYFVWLLPLSIFILRLSVLKHISIVCSFLLLSRINDVTIRSSIHLGIDIWYVSRLLLFQIQLLKIALSLSVYLSWLIGMPCLSFCLSLCIQSPLAEVMDIWFGA